MKSGNTANIHSHRIAVVAVVPESQTSHNTKLDANDILFNVILAFANASAYTHTHIVLKAHKL